MPATTNTSQYSTTVQNSTLAGHSQAGNTEISVITRVDYNLRFTKKAILVLGNDSQSYSKLANEFLVHLSTASVHSRTNQINVALVSASNKLNDLQIRCRVIEQLFVNTLFDPETSLAKSVIELAKVKGDAISIVIDHAQALSLQVKYELCQLAELAKKEQLNINVILFGLTEAATELTINKALVKNRLVMIDAESGQVIGLNSSRFQNNENKLSLNFAQKLMVYGFIIILTVMVGVYNLGGMVKPIQSIEPNKNVNVPIIAEIVHDEPSVNTLSINSKNKLQDDVGQKADSVIAEKKELNTNASSADILTALLLKTESKEQDKEENIEDNSPLSKVEEKTVKVFVEVEPVTNKEISLSTPVTLLNSEKINTTNDKYYLSKKTTYPDGFVIQLAGFSDAQRWKDFIEQNSNLTLFSYQKRSNNTDLIVVTSVVFPSKIHAKKAVGEFSSILGASSPWIKSISVVSEEINTFNR